MKLTEFNNKPTTVATKALKEHFNTSVNFDKLDLHTTNSMLYKVKGLLSEMKTSDKVAQSEQNPTYLKLTFMEQALSHRYGELKTLPMYNPKIVLENEEVEKSQVILAANEMVDELQKMIETVSDMLVKELPAVVDGINSEIGTNEGEQFNSQVTEALSSLQAALTQSKTGLQGALGTITGQGGGFGDEMGGAEEAPEMGGEEMGLGDEEGMDMSGEEPESEPDLPELPEKNPKPNLGRSTR